MIKRVELDKVMSHEHTVVEFGRGVNAIVGPNGSGKSAIIDSIVFALIGGCVRGEEAVRAELSNMVRVGSRRASITVEFEIGGKCYRAERVIALGGDAQSQVSLRECSGALVAHGRESFCNKMRELLGLDNLKALTYTLVARQGHLSDFIDSEPSKRAEMTLELLGLAWLDKAKEALGRALKSLDVEVAVLSREEERARALETECSSLRKRLEKLSELEKKLSEEVGELEARVEAARREVEELGSVLPSLEKLRAYERYKREAEALEREVGELRERAEKLSPYREAASLAREELAYYTALENKARRLERELAELEKRLERLLGGSTLEELEARLEEQKRVEEELLRRYKELEAEEKIVSAVLQAGLSSDKCPLCGSPLDESRRRHIEESHGARLEELKREVPRLKRLLDEATARRRELEDSIKKAREVVAELERARRELEESRAELESLLEKYNRLAERLGLPRAESFEECKLRLRDVESSLAELEKVEKTLERKLGSLSAIKSALAQFDETEIERARAVARALGAPIEEAERVYRERSAKLEELRSSLEKTRGRLAEVRGEMSALESQLASREAELAKLRESLKSLAAKKKALAVAEKLYGEYLGKSGYISVKALESFRKSFSIVVNDVLARLGRDFAIELTDNLDVRVRREGQELSVNSLSGGEKTMLSIVSRIALASMVSNKRVSVLILDEPTEYLDAEARKTVFETIREVAGYIDQIIVVTHDPEVEDIADTLVHVEKRGGSSRVVVEKVAGSS
ncbi:MAG: SMC family ATPase [Acidilobaceae archaeon]